MIGFSYRWNVVFFIILIGGSYNICLAQNLDAESRADHLLELAHEEAKNKSFQQSNYCALEASELFKVLNNWDKYTDSYYRIFLNGYFSNTIKETITYLSEGKTYIKDDEKLSLAKFNHYLGFSYNELGNVQFSVDYFRKSEQYYKYQKDTLGLSKICSSLGLGYLQFSDYSKAINYLQKALNFDVLNEQNKWKTLKLLGQSYFYKGNYYESKIYFKKAQQIKDHKDGSFDVFYGQLALANNELKDALSLVTKALKSTNPIVESDAIELLGDIYLKMGKPELAIVQYSNLRKRHLLGSNRRNLAKLDVLIGDTYFNLKDYDKALDYYQFSLNEFLIDFKSSNHIINPKYSQENIEIHLPEVFLGKGHCFFEKYINTKDKKWLQLSYKNYSLAINYIQNIKLHYEDSEVKLALGSSTQSYYESAIKVGLMRYKQTQNPIFKEEAFIFSQKATAFVLRELYNNENALLSAQVSPNLIYKLDSLKNKVNLINKSILENDIKQDYYKSKLVNEIDALYRLRESINKKYPKYNKLRNDLSVVDVEAVQENIDNNSLVIKYFRGQKDLYIFGISKSKFTIEKTSIFPDLDVLINRFRKSLSDMDYVKNQPQKAEEDFTKSSNLLYELLLQKTLLKHNPSDQINRLKIVTDGVIATIPFQALATKPNQGWGPNSSLLLKKYAISYSYFCKMITIPYKTKIESNKFVSFGVEFDRYTIDYLKRMSKDTITKDNFNSFTRSKSFSKLPFSDEEAEEVANLMNGKSWTNINATKSSFIENTNNADIIHVATHSYLDIEHPERSKLVFNKTRDTLDNFLTANEIYDLEFDAHLITLSACNSAYGQINNGEGINSLARAFYVSGIPSMTATLWSISDESTMIIMKSYYQFLNEGFTKDIALQKAQLAYLENDDISSPSFRMPIYWAAWKSIGNDNPIAINKKHTYRFTYLAIVLIGILLLYFLKKNNFN